MELAKAHALVHRLHSRGWFVLYSGSFLDEHAPGLIAMAEGLSGAIGRTRAQAHRLSFVLVEAYQNIIRHRAQVGGAGSRSLILLQVGPEADLVMSLDPVANEEAQRLDTALHDIARSDSDQLKVRFLARLRDGARTLRGGAGLGLIEMARRSGGGLLHAWLPLDEEHRLLLLQILFAGQHDLAYGREEAQALQALIGDLDARFALRLGCSASAEAAALRIMELESASPDRLATVFHAAREWLSDAAPGLPAAVALLGAGSAQRLLLSVAGPFDRLEAMRAQAQAAMALDKAELEARHRSALLGREAPGAMSAALLELARMAHGHLIHAVVEEGDSAWLHWAIPVQAGR
jgi:hypothetical protein